MKRMNCTIKRIWVFFIAFIIAIALCACANNMSGSQSGQNSASENTDILLEFKSFLDGEGFVGGVSQSKFIDEIVPQYTYEGKTIPEIIAGCKEDGTACPYRIYCCLDRFLVVVPFADEIGFLLVLGRGI